jgi:hypothetical protein
MQQRRCGVPNISLFLERGILSSLDGNWAVMKMAAKKKSEGDLFYLITLLNDSF